MKKLISLYLVSTCFLFGGCANEPPLNSGKVVAKRHYMEEKYVQNVSIPHRIRVGKGTHVTFYTTRPTFYHIPEHWAVTIVGEINGQTREREVNVSCEGYDSVSIGAVYNVRPGDGIDTVVESRTATEMEKAEYKVRPAS